MFWLISICKLSSQSDRYGTTRSEIFRENVDYLNLVFVMPASLILKVLFQHALILSRMTYLSLPRLARDCRNFISRELKVGFRNILCFKCYAPCIEFIERFVS